MSFLGSNLIQVRRAIEDLERADDSEALRKVGADLPFQELVGLATKLVKRSDELNQTRNQLEESRRREQLSSVATQVAHDLRSPVLALTALSRELDKLSRDELTRSIETSARRIDQISKDILDRYKVTATKAGTYTFIYPILQAVVAESALVSPSIQIHLDIACEDRALGLQIPESDLGRIFSNILSNATSAVDRKRSGDVRVTVKNSFSFIEFIFEDAGQGMTTEVLDIVLRKGGTFNTPNGHGLGLPYVKNTLAQFQGRIKIESDWMKGTCVYLSFPKPPVPSWLISGIDVLPNSKIAIIDDVTSVLELWKNKLTNFDSEFFRKPSDSRRADLFIVDQEIRGSAETGRQYLERNAIASKTSLSTGHHAQEKNNKECERRG